MRSSSSPSPQPGLTARFTLVPPETQPPARVHSAPTSIRLSWVRAECPSTIDRRAA